MLRNLQWLRDLNAKREHSPSASSSGSCSSHRGARRRSDAGGESLIGDGVEAEELDADDHRLAEEVARRFALALSSGTERLLAVVAGSEPADVGPFFRALSRAHPAMRIEVSGIPVVMSATVENVQSSMGSAAPRLAEADNVVFLSSAFLDWCPGGSVVEGPYDAVMLPCDAGSVPEFVLAQGCARAFQCLRPGGCLLLYDSSSLSGRLVVRQSGEIAGQQLSETRSMLQLAGFGGFEQLSLSSDPSDLGDEKSPALWSELVISRRPDLQPWPPESYLDGEKTPPRFTRRVAAELT